MISGYIIAYVISKLTDPQTIAGKVAGPIYSCLKSRYYAKEIGKDKNVVQSELRTLEDTLIDLRGEIKQKNPTNWLQAWDSIEQLKKTAFMLSSEVSSPDLAKYASGIDKAVASEKKDRLVKDLAEYISPLQEIVSELRQKPEHFDNVTSLSLRSYMLCLRDAYVHGELPLETAIKSFEAKHQGTRIAIKCREKRLALAQLHKNASNEPDVDIYIGEVRTKLSHNAPEWSPLGFYLNETDAWKIKSNSSKKVMGKQSQYFFHPVTVSCEYVSAQKLGELDFNKDANKARRFTDKYVVKAIVTEKAPNDLVKRVAGFSDPNMSVFLYETDKGRLTYNENSLAASAFSPYFTPSAKPVGMNQLLESFESGGSIPESELRQKLRLSDAEIDKLDIVSAGSGKFAFYDHFSSDLNTRTNSRGVINYEKSI